MKLCHWLRTIPSQKMGLQYQKNLLYLTEVKWDIYCLPFVQSKVYQISGGGGIKSFNNISLIIV